MGSPPHTWRILASYIIAVVAGRITSTYVENTFLTFSESSIFKDHLHIRGEYWLVMLCQMIHSGSPPHTWRIRTANNSNTVIVGITSTYVENTGFAPMKPYGNRDHLHIRGEYKIFGYQIFLMIGSPPHTWRIRYIDTIQLTG